LISKTACSFALTSALTDLSSQISAISDTAREISHGLYPTHLEYLGLAKALKRLCDEFKSGKSIPIHLTVGNLPRAIAALDLAFPISRRPGNDA
jgi:signal transduction histidine kinase